MSGPSTLSALHARANQLLVLKLRHIPTSVFPGRRKPSITDIYTNNADALWNPRMPANCQIDYIFMHHDDFASSKFRARKTDQDIGVTTAIWDWQIDLWHSFAAEHQMMRWNLLLAYLPSQSALACAEMSSEVKEFLGGYCSAWMSKVLGDDGSAQQCENWIVAKWRHSAYDLTHWSKKHQRRLSAAVCALTALVPDQPCAIAEFWTRAKQQPAEVFEKNKAAWAIQYLVYLEQAWTAEEKAEWQLTRDLGKMGIAEGPPEWLTEETFRQPLVQALMMEVDENVMVQEKEFWAFLIGPAQGVAVLDGKAEGIESLEDIFKGMTFLE